MIRSRWPWSRSQPRFTEYGRPPAPSVAADRNGAGDALALGFGQ